MFRRFLPYEVSFFDYFDQQAEIIVQAAQTFSQLVSPEVNIRSLVTQIIDLEHRADDVTHQCVEALHKTFITPFERNDIYQLISRMDDVVDYIKDAAEHIQVYRLTNMTKGIEEMADVLVRSSIEVQKALKGLRSNEGIDQMRRYFTTLHRLENEGDVVLRYSVSLLFDHENDTKTIIKWKEVYEDVEKSIDSCEDIANIIEGVIMENS